MDTKDATDRPALRLVAPDEPPAGIDVWERLSRATARLKAQQEDDPYPRAVHADDAA